MVKNYGHKSIKSDELNDIQTNDLQEALGFLLGVLFFFIVFASVIFPITKEPVATLITALILAIAVRDLVRPFPVRTNERRFLSPSTQFTNAN